VCVVLLPDSESVTSAIFRRSYQLSSWGQFLFLLHLVYQTLQLPHILHSALRRPSHAPRALRNALNLGLSKARVASPAFRAAGVLGPAGSRAERPKPIWPRRLEGIPEPPGSSRAGSAAAGDSLANQAIYSDGRLESSQLPSPNLTVCKPQARGTQASPTLCPLLGPDY
jgi:hypothetical protein